MATAIVGPVVTDIRGSVADVTFGRNRGGLFIRQRVAPLQPASDERNACQAALTAISQAWSATLTEAQRSSWRSYGRQHPLPDRWGRPKPTPGLCGFLRSNVQRYRDETALTALAAPAQPPPPMPAFELDATAVGALDVAGDPVPDVTGVYHLVGEYDAHDMWKLDGQDRWIAWHQPYTLWVMIAAPGPLVGPFWFRAAPVTGVYAPQAPALGNPTAAWSTTVSAVHINPSDAIWLGSPANTRLFAYAGVQVTHGRNYFNGPWRYIGRNTYDGADWTLDPWITPHWATLTSPGRIFLRLVAVLDDGATSCAGYARTNIAP